MNRMNRFRMESIDVAIEYKTRQELFCKFAVESFSGLSFKLDYILYFEVLKESVQDRRRLFELRRQVIPTNYPVRMLANCYNVNMVLEDHDNQE